MTVRLHRVRTFFLISFDKYTGVTRDAREETIRHCRNVMLKPDVNIDFCVAVLTLFFSDGIRLFMLMLWSPCSDANPTIFGDGSVELHTSEPPPRITSPLRPRPRTPTLSIDFLPHTLVPKLPAGFILVRGRRRLLRLNL